jgi:hypothetical protein
VHEGGRSDRRATAGLLAALVLAAAGCGGGNGGGAGSPNAPISLAAVTERPYRLYSVILNPGTQGLNIGLDSAFLSVAEAVAATATATLRDLTRTEVANGSTRDLRFNRGSGTFRSRLRFDAGGGVRIEDGRSVAGIFETFGSAADDRLGIYFPNTADRTLTLETELTFATRAGFDGRAILDVDRASISEGAAEVIALPFRLRNVAVTDPPRPAGEILVRAAPATSTAEAALVPLALHGFGVALKESDGRTVYGRDAFGGWGGAPRRYTAIIFETGRSDVTDLRTAAAPAPATRTATTLRRPLQALAIGDLAIDGAGEIVYGSFSPALDSELGLGTDRVVLAVEGRVFPLEGLIESPSGANVTGLFGGEVRTSDGGPLGTTLRIVEMKLSESRDLAVGVGTARLEATTFVREDDGSTTERTSVAEAMLLMVLFAQDRAAVPAVPEQGNEYHYLAIEPFDAPPSTIMVFPEASTDPLETRTIAIQNGGPSPDGRGAIGATGGGLTTALAQFLVGVNGIGSADVTNRYRWSGRIDGEGVSQVGTWQSPGRGDLLIGSSFQFGAVPGEASGDSLAGRLGDFAVLGGGGALGIGISDFDNPNGARLFFLSRRRAIDAPGVQALLDLFK